MNLTEPMFEALQAQKKIYDQFKGKYFFCSINGETIHLNNLRNRVWIPVLKKANLKYRAMAQTRHSFATLAISSGENPLWIANVLGHGDSKMIIKVYSKFVKNSNGYEDGKLMTDRVKSIKSKNR